MLFSLLFPLLSLSFSLSPFPSPFPLAQGLAQCRMKPVAEAGGVLASCSAVITAQGGV